VGAKRLLWVGSALKDLRACPREARRELGFDLRRFQADEMPRDWKPVSSLGAGVVEIRVHTGGEFRLMYIAKFAEGIYVLHVFQKKSRKTSSGDIAVARARLAEVRRARKVS
jgi:phage-related protein